jgi:hypothetical protein
MKRRFEGCEMTPLRPYRRARRADKTKAAQTASLTVGKVGMIIEDSALLVHIPREGPYDAH